MVRDEPAGAPHPDDPLLLACRRLARAMDAFDEAACRSLGVGRSDLRALNLLEHGPLSAATLADGLGLSRATVTTLIDRLENAGYVERTPDPDDRRSVRIALQPATFAAFARIYRPLGIEVYGAVSGLSDDNRHVVVTALAAMASAFVEAGGGLDILGK